MVLWFDVVSVFVVSFGLLAGHNIAGMSRTELKVGQRYFPILERLLLSVVVFYSANEFIDWRFSLGISMLLFAVLWEYPLRNLLLTSGILGLASSLSSFNIFAYSFLYFIVRGTQNYYHKESMKTLLTGMGVYIVIGILSLLLTSFF